MGRQIRTINEGLIALKQKGDFFFEDGHKELYTTILEQTANKLQTKIFGYNLANSEVFIFLECKNLPKFMQSLNSTFIKERNKISKNLNINKKSDIKRYNAMQVYADDINKLLSYIEASGGKIFTKAPKTPLNIDFKIEIKNLRRKKNMKFEPLDSVKHAKLMYHQTAVPNLGFCEISASEVALAARDLPIVFTSDIVPKLVVLLGQDSNTIMDKNYKGYVPTNMKSYPFMLAQVGKKGIICVDTNAAALKGKGEPLFDKDGKQSEFLQNLAKVLAVHNAEQQKTIIAMQELKKLGILQNKELSITIEEKKFTLFKGFCVVNRKKLNELDDKTLAQLVRQGYMDLIIAHIHSLANLEHLISSIVGGTKKAEPAKQTRTRKTQK